jgi:hypothetical protein
VEVTNEDGSEYATFTSYLNGVTDMGALHVEIDIFAAIYATPVGSSYVRIWGVPLTLIAQGKDFNGKRIKVYGGMQKGLPLANPRQAGLLATGIVNQGFGNWSGTNQSLDLVMRAADGTAAEPKNIVLDWRKNTQISAALQSTLSYAFPGRALAINISASLVQGRDETGYWETLPQFATWLKAKTRAMKGGDYAGVDIAAVGDSIRAYDATSSANPLEVQFNDMIGQPTWIDPATVQVTCVMRADVGVGDYIHLPRAQVTTTPQSLSQFRDASVFQGAFLVKQVRHVGAYRQPDAAAWVTVIDANPAPGMAGAA